MCPIQTEPGAGSWARCPQTRSTAARAPAGPQRLRWGQRNQRWAARVGLDTLTPQEWENHFARFAPLPDNQPQPLAMRYHGHQFRTYNPDIGDGRGFLFAQLEDDQGRLLDLQEVHQAIQLAMLQKHHLLVQIL